MPVLILARHGNTFEKGQTPTMVGARTDMPLTQEGEAQGHALAEKLASYFPLGGIITGPLIRTKRFAEIISQKANNVFVIDERLTEVDYGLWENKTSADIAAQYGPEILENWEKEGIWPQDMNWAPSEEKLKRNIHMFLDEQHKKLLGHGALNRVVITSNGILRFVYRHLTDHAPDAAAKVKTGNYCVLMPTQEEWKIEGWNLSV